MATTDAVGSTGWAVPASLAVAALLVAGSSAALFKWPRKIQQTASKPEGPIRVIELLVHPIKSCRGTSVQSSRFTPTGLEHDRRWVLINPDKGEVLTARQVPEMVMIYPVVNEAAGTLDINFPHESGCPPFSVPLRPTDQHFATWETVSGLKLFSMTDLDGYIVESLPGHPNASAALSAFLNRPVHLVIKGPTPRLAVPTPSHPALGGAGDGTTVLFQDGYPLLVASEEALREVETMTRRLADEGVDRVDPKWRSERLEIRRFRPNILISGGGAFSEDWWAEAEIGEGHKLDIVSLCARCQLPQVDPNTGIPDASIPTKALAQFRKGVELTMPYKNCFGVNAVGRPASGKDSGVVRVGDVVKVLRRAEGRLKSDAEAKAAR